MGTHKPASATQPPRATLQAERSLLLVIDLQQKLLAAIHDATGLRSRAARLAQAARLMGVPVVATEHWPDKIGATHPDIAPHVDRVFAKTHFDATLEADFVGTLPAERPTVLLCGTEAHVCVLQTGLGLAAAGLQPILVVDAIGSRRPADAQAARERWAHHGLQAITLEMALFEWLRTPAHPAFRQVLALIKQDGQG